MAKRRVGIWLIGAYGSVGSTVALGLSTWARNPQHSIGLVTEPFADKLGLDAADAFVVGGHDVKRSSFIDSVRTLHRRSGVFRHDQIEAAASDLSAWSRNVRIGTAAESNSAIRELADAPEALRTVPTADTIGSIQADLAGFQSEHRLDQVVVINVASTEPPFVWDERHQSLALLKAAIGANSPHLLASSSIYAYSAIDMGFPYVNFTPSAGASCPALAELAVLKRVPIAGQDGKTGETLLKTVLAPMFAARNLKVLSWVGHNILGGGDGRVLADPANKASKISTKDAPLHAVLGYRPQSLVSIEYVESLDDWKTAWDHVHFEGFLGTRMTMQVTWQGCDSILAAPLVIDLARLSLDAQRRDRVGIQSAFACFFKSPMGTDVHDFSKQWAMLNDYVAGRL